MNPAYAEYLKQADELLPTCEDSPLARLTMNLAAALRDAVKQSVVLNAPTLREALAYVAPDNSPEQDESEIVLVRGDGHDGPGLYAYFADYPEEGSIKLTGNEYGAQPSAPVAQHLARAVLDMNACWNRGGNHGEVAEQLDLCRRFANDVMDGRAAHPDDIAVDRFSFAMKDKMAVSRAKGRSGWDDRAYCSKEFLQEALLNHLGKGDPVDIGNFAMMLFNRGEPTASAAQPAPAVADESEFKVGDLVIPKMLFMGISVGRVVGFRGTGDALVVVCQRLKNGFEEIYRPALLRHATEHETYFSGVPTVADGYVLVPKEPTAVMVSVGANEVSDYYDDGMDQRHREIARFSYQAMLAASALKEKPE